MALSMKKSLPGFGLDESSASMILRAVGVLQYALVARASFRQADLEGADLLYTDIKRARFDGATIGRPTTTIPGIYACGRREWQILAAVFQ